MLQEHYPQQSKDEASAVKACSRKCYALGFASTGTGHYSAAAALAAQIRSTEPSSSIRLVNVLGGNQSMWRRLIEEGWLFLSSNRALRPLYSLLYPRLVANLLVCTVLQRLLSSICRNLAIELAATGVNHFIALHPLGVPLGAKLKQMIDCRLTVVATDHVLHGMHCHDLVDQYFVPHSFFALGRVAEKSIERGLVWHRRIPISENFREYASPPGFKCGNRFRIIVSFGAAGIRGLESTELVRQLVLRMGESVEFELVAGSNIALRRAFLHLRDEFRDNCAVRVYGFVENMAELMRNAQLLVGKPGGLTITEARQIGLPIAIIDKLPGQEDFNCRVIVSEQVGTLVEGAGELVAFVNRLQNPEEWQRWSRPGPINSGSVVAVTPNPSLKLTRYGRRCKPGLSHQYYRLSPGLQPLPPRPA